MFNALLVEDNEAVRLIVEKQLRHEGIEVSSVETGEKAVQLAADIRDFDVAVLDCVLPGNLDGVALVRALRKLCPGIGIVQMSGHPSHVQDYQTDNPHDVFLSKPVRRRELIEAVNYAYQAHSILRRDAG